MTTVNTDVFVINGPTREELVDAFKYAHDDERNFTVTFELVRLPVDEFNEPAVEMPKHGEVVPVMVTGLRHYSTSGTYYVVFVRFLPRKETEFPELQMQERRIFYHLKPRKGSVDQG